MHILLLLFAFSPINQTAHKAVDHNVVHLQHQKKTLQRLPFRSVYVMDGRWKTTDAVGAYTSPKFHIPLYLDTELSVAVNKYLSRWSGSERDSLSLCIYLRKYLTFQGKMALGADVYVENKGSYYELLREDTLFRQNWRYYISGGALDFLVEKVRQQWAAAGRRPGAKVSVKEMEDRKDGLAWNNFPILHSDSPINGVYLSIQDFLKGRLQPMSGEVDSVDGNTDSFVSIPMNEAAYTITFPKDSLKKYQWLREWNNLPVAITSQNGVLYLRLWHWAFLRLTKVGNTFVANASPDLVLALLPQKMTFNEVAPGFPNQVNSVTDLEIALIFGLFVELLKDSRNQIVEHHIQTIAKEERQGWHFYVDMDLGAVICY